MSIKHVGWARLALRQQVEFFGGDQVSLDSLWRSVGSPAGHDPQRWSELEPRCCRDFPPTSIECIKGRKPSPLQRNWCGSGTKISKDPWRTGDHMSHEFIAWTYATYLDAHHERRVVQSHCRFARRF